VTEDPAARLAQDPAARLEQIVRESGLVRAGSRGVALLSGGPDSACLAAGLARTVGAEAITALHVNYGIRADSDHDQGQMAALCEGLGIADMQFARSDRDWSKVSEANLQAEAREFRYQLAEETRARVGADWIATGHTLTDLAETVIYRLASSPGRRALLGLPPRRGYVVRPLLELTRAETRELAQQAGLPFADDPSNLDRRFRRVQVREEVLPVLREINPAAEANIAATQAELAEEDEALEQFAAEALEAAGADAGAAALAVADLAELHPAVRRRALRMLAERAAGRDVALGRERAAEIWRLAQRPEGGEVDLGGDLRALCESGTVRFAGPAGTPPQPAELTVPGSCRFGAWEVRAELGEFRDEPAGADTAVLDPQRIGSRLLVRGWREGDRMRPLGLDGTKSLQDLFTDRHVPRSLRHTLPVVARDGDIAWIAGVAVSEDFRARSRAGTAVVLSAALAEPQT
jgi:tRNA(Ile)-lysidine synthase